MNKIKQIEELLKNKQTKEAQKLFKTLSQEEINELEKKYEKTEFKSVLGHKYQGWNRYFLAILSKPGIFGTYVQWNKQGYKLKKSSKGKGIGILIPIIGKNEDDKEEIKYFKVAYVFHEEFVEKIEE